MSKPTVPFALSLAGGIFVLLGAEASVAMSAFLSALPFVGSFVGGVAGLIAGLGVASGVMMIAGAVLMYVKPQKHAIWGAIVVAGSVLSWVGAFGGIIIGFLLGLIGGVLGIVRKSSVSVAPKKNAPKQSSSSQFGTLCSSCGAALASGSGLCKSCGAAQPVPAVATSRN